MGAPNNVGRRSFRQLLGRDVASADAAFGEKAPDNAWEDITNTLNTLDVPARQASIPTTKQKHHHQYELDDDDHIASSADAILRDTSLKTVANIASDRTLDWLLTPSTLSKIIASEMLSKSTDEPPSNLDELGEDNDSDKHSIMFSASLLNYSHPTGKHHVPPGRWHTQLDDDASPSVARLLDWQNALRGVFYALRYRRIRGFYLRLATTVIRFSSGKDKHTIRAHIARSKSLENLLEEYCVEHDPDSTGLGVIVSEMHNVHALYNMLLSKAPSLPTARDVPLIICDEPFPHASQAEAVIQHAFAAADDTGNMRYTVRIVGVLTSVQVHRLCQALSAVQDFDLALVTDEMCGPTTNDDCPRISSVRCVDGELQALSRRT